MKFPHRAFAFAALALAAFPALGQEAFDSGLPPQPDLRDANGNQIPLHSAWLDLRQNAGVHSKPQSAPGWVESISLVPVAARAGLTAERTIFRIRIRRPHPDLQVLLFRVFFDDKPGQRPALTAWDESGTQLLRSGELGAGIDLPSSDTVMLPMIGVSCVDLEVPGHGANIRGAYLDWMTSRKVAHPLSAETNEIIPEPFAAAAPLQIPTQDSESFGTVTASLAPEVIRMGASVQAGAALQFGLESQPLMALLTFEVSTPRIEAPPEIYVNGENLGPASLVLPHLADPAYRGETERLVQPMRFRYTGWVRAQKLVPAVYLKTGTNDVIVIGGPGTPDSAIRATQIQLKYLWDKSDYLLDPQ